MTSIIKFNKVIAGFIPGIFIPFITLVIFYFSKSNMKGFLDYINFLIELNSFSKVLSLCAIPNLLIFYYYLNRSLYYSARGVIFATFLWVVIVIIVRYLI
jgi:hypothetical protein